MERKNLWNQYTEQELQHLDEISCKYKGCLDMAKTERECVELSIEYAKGKGYLDIEEFIKNGKKIKAGDKIYSQYMNKMLILFNIGTDNFEKGMNILGAHIDSPRLDLKQVPIYEDSELAYMDTHYYGGIKKYQWVTTPLSIHGVVAKKDGSIIKVVIGESEDEPVLAITDLLVHLAQEQVQKKASVVIEGESLDVLIGSRPINSKDDNGKELVKANILKFFKEKYGVDEEDFLSAELEIVPAGKARDCGLDRSMILGYGQDDRVCAFTSLFAMLEVENPIRTTCCILVDKEEIGSTGATGMQSRYFEDIVDEISLLLDGSTNLTPRRALRNSCMLSSDVSAAYDPLYAGSFEKKNTALFSRGLVLNKYTGSRGKYECNDANAEYIAELRKVFDDNNIGFQTGEIGKVDAGGGGTIAYIMSHHGMRVIDSGVPVLSMHAPYEISSKADVFEAYRGYKAFLINMR